MSAEKLSPEWTEFYDQNVAKAVEEDSPHYILGLMQACMESTNKTPEEKLAHVEYILQAYQTARKGEPL